jgi:spore maturation protein CgeB
MHKAKRIFVISSLNYDPVKMFFVVRKFIKGFIRLGHDVMEFNYKLALNGMCPIERKTIALKWYKPKVDILLTEQIKSYQPDIVLLSFARGIDSQLLEMIKKQVPNTIIVGLDGDPWPKLQRGRIQAAQRTDVLFATNDGQWLQDYRDEGVKRCHFIANSCDPDIERRYEVGEEFKSDILWIGGLAHGADMRYELRKNVIEALAKRDDSRIFGCCGRGNIGGMDCIYNMSGAKIGVSINAYEGIRLCHSDRLIRLLSCGSFVLSNRFEDCELLYKDGVHLKYFETVEEFFELADYYLKHEEERKKIADAGMNWVHEEFNCVKIAGYMLDAIENGEYNAPWVR